MAAGINPPLVMARIAVGFQPLARIDSPMELMAWMWEFQEDVRTVFNDREESGVIEVRF